MPKKVHDMVNEMLANPDFYPEKSKKQQEAIAWATAWSKYKKKKNEYRVHVFDGKVIDINDKNISKYSNNKKIVNIRLTYLSGQEQSDMKEAPFMIESVYFN